MSHTTAAGNRIDAFCSYNQEDRGEVAFVVKQLEVRGSISSFLDEAIEPGAVWIQRLQGMILLSETFLFFVRRAPTQWQLRELNLAIELQTKNGKPYIIPVLLPGLQDNAFFNNPNVAFIRASQAAQFSHSIHEIDVIDGLVRAIAGNSRVYVSSRALPRTDNLPSGFQADLGRLTELLIGESVYKSKNICVRELIQNSRDACSRLARRYDQGLRSPETIVRVDAKNRFFDVIDYGDGMSRNVLSNSFAVLGKSLNDEYRAPGAEKQDLYCPVIGKFGVGFISTFMIAERVIVSTRALEDVAHHFSIIDVKAPFQYGERTACERNTDDNGTTIRVYLKSDYSIGSNRLDISALMKQFCRHVPDLYLADGKQKYRVECDWNHGMDESIIASISNESYEIRLAWASSSHDSLVLSNGGFFVGPLAEHVLGDLPKNIVTGEINVAPGFVDLNLSRDDIVSNEKIEDLRNAIGSAIGRLLELSAELLKSGRDEPRKLAKLAEVVRRSSLVIGSLIKNSRLGQIPIRTAVNYKRLYWSALIVYLAFKGSGSRDRRHTFDILRRKLEDGSITIVYAERFQRANLFPQDEVMGGYIAVVVESIDAQLPSKRITLKEMTFADDLPKLVGANVITERTAFNNFFGWRTPKGFLIRSMDLIPYLGGVVAVILMLFGLYVFVVWLWHYFKR